jgi:hypothetical protein
MLAHRKELEITMIPQLSPIQYDAATAAAASKALVQIQPDETLDKPEIYKEWKYRVDQVDALVALGLLQEDSAIADPIFEKLATQFPNRKFKKYIPTYLGQKMFERQETRGIQ